MFDDATEWILTSVYRPQLEVDKIGFMDEIKALRQRTLRRMPNLW
jgi:hypothetical protein